MYTRMPACMAAPCLKEYAEIRCNDIQAKNLDEFKAHLHKYEGPKLRFLVPEVIRSNAVRISFNSQEHIMQFLLNYIMRDRVYSETVRNCQVERQRETETD